MKTLTFLALVLASTTTVFAAAPTTRPAEELERENAALRQRVAALDKHIDQLQAQIDSLKKQRSGVTLDLSKVRPGVPQYNLRDGWVVPPNATLAIPVPAPRAVPPGWIERQFNGQPYYLIPMEQARQSVAPAKP